MSSIEELRVKIERFAKERDWDQFHSPKNLAMALSAEVGELVEHFQWLTEEQSKNLNSEVLAEVADEVADVQVYLIRLADKLGINIMSTVEQKIEKNESKYPADKVRGSAKKYTAYAKNLEHKK